MMRSFFLKRLKKYFTLLMIPVILLLIAILITSGSAQLRALKRSSSNALSNMHSSFNSIYENTCYQQNMMTLNPQLTISLRKILMRRRSINYSDYVFLNSMKSILSTAAGSHPSVHSIYLYIDRYDNFLSSSDGVAPLEGYYDADWAQLYSDLPETRNNVVVRRAIPANGFRQDIPVLTVFQRLTYIPGVIVLNIEEHTFMDGMRAYLPSDEHRLLVLDENGQTLLESDEGEVQRSAVERWFKGEQEIANEVEPTFARIGNRYYLISRQRDNRLGLCFLLMLPLPAVIRSVLSGLIAPLLIALLVGFLILLLAWVTTRQNFSQIDYVIQLFKDAENGTLSTPLIPPTHINNEYDVIINNVIRSFMNTTFLDKQLAEQRYEKQTAELTALQLQINPHFLMNTLQTLDFEVCKLTNSFHSPLNLIISNLSDILRYSLASVDAPVTLGDEIVNVRKYVEIQNFRFPDTITVFYDIDEAALALPFKRLLLQPLVENSISHGIRPALRPGKIRIRIRIHDGILTVKCVDNGVGIPREKLALLRDDLSKGGNHKSIGLNNVNRRLVLNYGEDSTLKILSHEGLGTCISFFIPIAHG